MAGRTLDSSTTSQSLALSRIVARDRGMISSTASTCVTECVRMETLKQAPSPMMSWASSGESWASPL